MGAWLGHPCRHRMPLVLPAPVSSPSPAPSWTERLTTAAPSLLTKVAAKPSEVGEGAVLTAEAAEVAEEGLGLLPLPLLGEALGTPAATSAVSPRASASTSVAAGEISAWQPPGPPPLLSSRPPGAIATCRWLAGGGCSVVGTLQGAQLLEDLSHLKAWYRAESLEDVVRCLTSDASVAKIAFIGSPLGDCAVGQLAKALGENTTVLRMALDQCHITDVGAERLARALEQNDSLLALSLEGNRIGDRGVAHLAAALERNEVLISLSLGRNRVGLEGYERLAASLEANHTLRTLDLSSNWGDRPPASSAAGGREAMRRIQALLKQNRAPQRVITLLASPCVAGGLAISCLSLAGNEVAVLETEPKSELWTIRTELAKRLNVPRPKLQLVLPDGRWLSRADDRKQIGDLVGVGAGITESTAG